MPTLLEQVEAQRMQNAAQYEQIRQSQQAAFNYAIGDVMMFNKNMALYGAMHPETTDKMIASGLISPDYGNSRFDKRISDLHDYSNLDDFRANEQSTLGKWVNAGIKTGLKTATTFANMLNTGLGLMIYPWATKKGLSGIVNNPVTEFLLEVDDEIEKIFPNYRTTQEQEAPWWQRMGTANFWADDVMKNVGFSMGSVLGAKLATKGIMGIARLAEKKAYREAFEAIGKKFISNLGGKEIREVIDKGLKIGGLTAEKMNALSLAGKLLKADNIIAGVSGSVLGALGEAQYEAATAVRDFTDTNLQKLDNWFQNNEEYIKQMYSNEDGKIDGVSLSYDEFKRRKYEDAKNEISEQAIKVGNSVFEFETALLTATNFATFRRFFSGGFRNFNQVTYKNGLKNLVGAESSNELLNNIGRRTTKDGTVEAFNKVSKLKNIASIAKPMFTEGPIEEMGQNFINKASEYYHGSYLNEYLGYTMNQDYNNEAASFVNSLGIGAARSYGNAEEWMDGFAGAIFGIAGIPGIHRNTKYKPKPKGQNGEEVEDTRTKEEKRFFDYNVIPFFTAEESIRRKWKDIQDRDQLIGETVNFVNDFIKDPEKINQFQTVVRNLALEHEMDKHITAQDVLQFKDDEQKALMNTIAAFQNAGMNDILDKYIESAGANLSDAQIEEIRSTLPEEEQTKSAQEIRERIQKEVNDVKTLVKFYRDIHDSINATYGSSFTPREIDVLTGLLSLADYKVSRMRDIMSKYSDLLSNNELTVSGDSDIDILSKRLITFLDLDSELMNNWDNMTDNERDINSVTLTMQVWNKMPKDWNIAKKKQVYNDLIDAFINLKESIQLNNEFADMVSNPKLMSAVFKKLFDDHLSEEERQKVVEKTSFLEAITDLDELEKAYDDLTDSEIDQKVKDNLEKSEQPLIKKLLDKKQKADLHNGVLTTLSKATDAMAEKYQVPTEYINELYQKLDAFDYEAAKSLLESLIKTETDANKLEVLKTILNWYNLAEVHEKSTKETKPTEQLENRKKALDTAFKDGILEKIIRGFWNTDTSDRNNISLLKQKYTILNNFAKYSDKDYTMHFAYSINMLNNVSSFVIVVTQQNNQKVGASIVIPFIKQAYNTDSFINQVAKIDIDVIREEITSFATQNNIILDSGKLDEFLQQRLVHAAIYNPFNSKLLDLLEKTHSDFVRLFRESATASVESEQNDEELLKVATNLAELQKESVQYIDNEIPNVQQLIEKYINDTNPAIQKAIFEIRKRITNSKLQQQQMEKLNEEFSKNADDEILKSLTKATLALRTTLIEMRKYVSDLKNLTAVKPDIQQFNLANNDKNDLRVITVTEFDLYNPNNEADLEDILNDTGGIEGEQTINYLESPTSRHIDDISVDSDIRQMLIDNDVYRNIYYAEAGDKISFNRVKKEDLPKSVQDYFGNEMPYWIVDDNYGEKIGLLLPDTNGKLYKMVSSNPQLTMKLKEKWASKSQLLPYTNTKTSLFNTEIKGVVFYTSYPKSDGSVLVTFNGEDIKQFDEFPAFEFQKLIQEKVLNGEIKPGQPYYLVDKGDSFKKKPNGKYNFYIDALSLPNIAEWVYKDELNTIISDFTNQFAKITDGGMLSDSDLSNEAKKKLQKLHSDLQKLFALGNSNVSTLEMDYIPQTNVWTLRAHIRQWMPDGSVVETQTIDLTTFTTVQEFINNFLDILQNKEKQDIYNIPGGIVPSINESTFHSDNNVFGFNWNAHAINDSLFTFLQGVPFNVSATMDFVISSDTQVETETKELQTPEVIDATKPQEPTFAGESKDDLSDFINDIESVRAKLKDSDTIKNLMQLIEEVGIPTTFDEFSKYIQRQLTVHMVTALNLLKNGVKVLQTHGVEVTAQNQNKKLFTYLYADTANRDLMTQLKDC